PTTRDGERCGPQELANFVYGLGLDAREGFDRVVNKTNDPHQDSARITRADLGEVDHKLAHFREISVGLHLRNPTGNLSGKCRAFIPIAEKRGNRHESTQAQEIRTRDSRNYIESLAVGALNLLQANVQALFGARARLSNKTRHLDANVSFFIAADEFL